LIEELIVIFDNLVAKEDLVEWMIVDMNYDGSQHQQVTYYDVVLELQLAVVME